MMDGGGDAHTMSTQKINNTHIVDSRRTKMCATDILERYRIKYHVLYGNNTKSFDSGKTNNNETDIIEILFSHVLESLFKLRIKCTYLYSRTRHHNIL